MVAPHPDDEVLMAGGSMRRHAAAGGEVVIIAVTDGEASHARSTRVTPEDLRRRRHDERDEALTRLGVNAVTVVRLGVPDQACGEHVDWLAASVRPHLRPDDVLITVTEADRHPDHVATARATVRAARGIVDRVLAAPTWALVHGDAPAPTCVVRLDHAEWCAKLRAIRAFRSQLEPLGPSPLDGPVVHPSELTVMVGRDERFTAVSTGATDA